VFHSRGLLDFPMYRLRPNAVYTRRVVQKALDAVYRDALDGRHYATTRAIPG